MCGVACVASAKSEIAEPYHLSIRYISHVICMNAFLLYAAAYLSIDLRIIQGCRTPVQYCMILSHVSPYD